MYLLQLRYRMFSHLDQSDFIDKDDFAFNQQVKIETTNEGKYGE